MGEIQKKTKEIIEQRISGDKKVVPILANASLAPFNKKLSHGAIKIDEVEILDKTQEKVRLKVRLHNEGILKVKELIQVYIKDINSIYATRTPKLCTFKAVELNEQEEQTIEINIRPEAFTIIDEKGDCYRDSNEFEIYICTTNIGDKDKMLIGKQLIIKKIQFQSIAENEIINL